MEKITVASSLILDLIVGGGMALLPIIFVIWGEIIIALIFLSRSQMVLDETIKKIVNILKIVHISMEVLVFLMMCLSYILGVYLYKLGTMAMFMGFITGAFVHIMLLIMIVMGIIASIVCLIVHIKLSKKDKGNGRLRRSINSIVFIMTGTIIMLTIFQYFLLQYGIDKYW